MDRFFKIIREDGGVFDIVREPETPDVFPFKAVECTQDEWWSWSVVNWREIDRMENDMVSMDTF